MAGFFDTPAAETTPPPIVRKPDRREYTYMDRQLAARRRRMSPIVDGSVGGRYQVRARWDV